MLSRYLLCTALISIPFTVQAEGLREKAEKTYDNVYNKAAKAYNEQAANFSDELLVGKANSPNWSWAWITPQHIHNELLKRASESQRRATKLSLLLLNSFEESRGMNGTFVQSLFLQVLSEAAKDSGKIELKTIKTIADKIKNLTVVVRDDEDFRAIADAREILNKRFIAAVGSNLLTTKNFERTYQFYQVLKDLRLQYDTLVIQSAEYRTTKAAILNHLFAVAEVQDFEKLVDLYLLDSGFNVAAALSNMHKLNAQATINLVKSQIEKFDEEKHDLSIITDEIIFLKSHASKEILAALMPKLLRLLELAEKRKDAAAQALIIDSFSGAGGGSSSNGDSSGGGAASSLTWGQISSGRGVDAKCSANANSALALYRKNLISGLEINFALRDLYKSCDQNISKAVVYGVIANICEEAKIKKDEEVLKSCYADVLMPLLQWITKNKNQENVNVAKEYAERLLKLLPPQTIAELKPSCQLRISISPIYDRREKLIEDGEILIVTKGKTGIIMKNCRDAESNFIIDRYAHEFSNSAEKFKWPVGPHSSCVREIIEHSTFKNVTDYLNVKLQKAKAPTETQKIEKGSPTQVAPTKSDGSQRYEATTEELQTRYRNINVFAETTIAIPGENSSEDACVNGYYYYYFHGPK